MRSTSRVLFPTGASLGAWAPEACLKLWVLGELPGQVTKAAESAP